MPTVGESRCCKEIDQVNEKMKAYSERYGAESLACIVDHPGFKSVCLNGWVLEAAYYDYTHHYSKEEEAGAKVESKMSPKLTILFFAAFLFVARAVPVSEDDDDDVNDVIEEAERADDNNVDLSDLTEEDIRDIVQHVQENLRRAVDEMSLDEVEMVHDEKSLEKRFLKNWNLGKGWSAGTSGISWHNRRGNMNFNVRPTFSNGLGFRAGFTWRF
ncbi:uncharacterized protein LOC121376958 isoform X2 [Gigantopelta aegis]|uniref:uncharacterized protein LOC121376958 isoform X2 n=1 Tax=Gigantopelta aegis TaxID=1735272 RepID=UPI001B88780C|nr:uncharacterized protein LOC121376958 isoform X2 [Gigantopelta aegis]